MYMHRRVVWLSIFVLILPFLVRQLKIDKNAGEPKMVNGCRKSEIAQILEGIKRFLLDPIPYSTSGAKKRM